MRRMLTILLIALFSSFTNVNLTNSSAKPITNNLPNTHLVIKEVVRQNVADTYLWDNFKIKLEKLPINLTFVS